MSDALTLGVKYALAVGAASAAVGIVVGVINTTGVGFRIGFMVTQGAGNLASDLYPLLSMENFSLFSVEDLLTHAAIEGSGLRLRAIICNITTGATISKATMSALKDGAIKTIPAIAQSILATTPIGTNQWPTTATDKAITPAMQLVEV